MFVQAGFAFGRARATWILPGTGLLTVPSGLGEFLLNGNAFGFLLVRSLGPPSECGLPWGILMIFGEVKETIIYGLLISRYATSGVRNWNSMVKDLLTVRLRRLKQLNGCPNLLEAE